MPATTDAIRWTNAENNTLEARTCPVCGIAYAAPERFFENRRAKGGSWVCPNGHSLSFTKTEVAELREKLDSEKTNAEFWRKRSSSESERAEHERSRANGYKGALTKTKKRISHGVCPCCNRTFVNVAEHMQRQHPDYVSD